jgi:addiction module HigA family antidote
MLKLTIEIVPHGDESRRKILETVQIVNTGKHQDRPYKGEYVCRNKYGSFIIADHDRSDGYWSLIRMIAERIVPNSAKTRNLFNPDYTVPPGETIKDHIVYFDMTLTELAAEMGITPARMEAIMEGSAEITQDIAERLSAALGMSARFWLNLEKQDRKPK